MPYTTGKVPTGGYLKQQAAGRDVTNTTNSGNTTTTNSHNTTDSHNIHNNNSKTQHNDNSGNTGTQTGVKFGSMS